MVFAWAVAVVAIEKLVQEVQSLILQQARILTSRLQKELSITTASFAPIGIMVGGKAVEVATRAAPIMEEKMALTLLLVLFHFLCLYYNYNRNIRKEK